MTITGNEIIKRVGCGSYMCKIFLRANDGTPIKLEYDTDNGARMSQFTKQAGCWTVILLQSDVRMENVVMDFCNHKKKWEEIKEKFFSTFKDVLGFAFGE